MPADSIRSKSNRTANVTDGRQEGDPLLQSRSRTRCKCTETSRIELDDHTIAAKPASDRPPFADVIKLRADETFDIMYEMQLVRIDPDPGLDTARETWCGRKFGNGDKPERPRQSADGRLLHSGLYERVAHPMVAGGVETRAIFAEIVQIGSRQDLPVRDARDSAVKIRFVEEAPVHRVCTVTRILELTCLDHAKRPVLLLSL